MGGSYFRKPVRISSPEVPLRVLVDVALVVELSRSDEGSLWSPGKENEEGRWKWSERGERTVREEEAEGRIRKGETGKCCERMRARGKGEERRVKGEGTVRGRGRNREKEL